MVVVVVVVVMLLVLMLRLSEITWAARTRKLPQPGK